MAELATPGFHHIGLVAASAARTRVFYRDVLGLTLLRDGADPPERRVRGDSADSDPLDDSAQGLPDDDTGPSDSTQGLPPDDAGPFDLLFGDRTGSVGSLVGVRVEPRARKGHWGVGGIHHLALGVADRTQQLRWKRWLTDLGIAVSGPYDRGYFHSIYFQDPDGQVLEIATRGPGYTFDESADTLGERFIRPDPARLRSQRDEAAIRARTYPARVEALDDDMRLDGIHHITGIVGDLDAAHALYHEALGQDRVKRTVNQDDGRTRHDFWASRDGPAVLPRSSITHFGWPESDYRARPGTGQTRHVAYRVHDDDELERWSDWLGERGFAVRSTPSHSLWRAVEFTGPDGLLHQLATDVEPLFPRSDEP